MKIRALFLFYSIVFPSLFASAANVTWTGTAGDWLWSTAENWDAGTVPTASDTAIVNAGTEQQPVVIDTDTTASPKRLEIARSASDTGVLSIDGSLSISGTDHVLVGVNGSGMLQLQGTFSIPRQLYIGCNTGAQGTFLVNGGKLQMGRDMYIGYNGTGVLEVVSGTTTARYYGIGEAAGSDGIIIVQEGASIQTPTGANGHASIGSHGTGRILMHGGSASPSTTYFQLIVREHDSAFGMLRGWGTWNTGKKVELNNSGLVIADGEGEERRLVINAAGTTCSSANSIDNDSTNGWYAVNKGQLYVNMRADVAVGETGVFTWGDANADEVIDMVNSARITFHSVSGKNGILSVGGTISAFDRTDAHFESLPAAATKVGNWTFSLTNGGGCSAYDLTLRYDHVAARGLALTLRRWNGSAWDAVDGVTWDSANYLAKATGLTPDTSTALGTFAIVGAAPSTCVLIR